MVTKIRLHLEVDRLVALLILAEGVVIAGQDSIQDDAHQGSHSQTGQADLVLIPYRRQAADSIHAFGVIC